MILLLDTSTGACKVTLVKGKDHHEYEWQADRTLARDLLAYLRDRLAEHGSTFTDLTGIGLMKGPGSFTGLRIGATVANTLSRELGIPIVGSEQENWKQMSIKRLLDQESDELILPVYGRPARITTPRK